MRAVTPAAVEGFRCFLAACEIETIPFDEARARAAAVAFDQYGMDTDPNARFNLADCAARALAKLRNAPPLFKGDDSTHTDLRPTLPL